MECSVLNGMYISHSLPKARESSQKSGWRDCRRQGCWITLRETFLQAQQDSCTYELLAIMIVCACDLFKFEPGKIPA